VPRSIFGIISIFMALPTVAAAMKRLASVTAALIIGRFLAGYTVALLEWALRSPAAQFCLDSGGRQLGDKPMPEAIARRAGQECREEMERRAIRARYQNAHSWPVNLAVGLIGFMLDPIRIALFALYAVGAYFAVRRIFRSR
jgi:hypothetical protein